MTAQASGEGVTGDRGAEIVAPTFSISYDASADILTIDGYKISGELLRSLTASPCGVMFRITERREGVLYIKQEIDPLATQAPDLLRALEAAIGQWKSWAQQSGVNLETVETIGGEIWRQSRNIFEKAATIERAEKKATQSPDTTSQSDGR